MSNATLDSDALAYCLALKDGPDAAKPASLGSLPPFAILAAAVRGVAALAVARNDDDDGIRLQDLVRYRAEPGDVVVAYVPALADDPTRERISAELKRVFKDQALLVSCGIGIEVVKPAGVSMEPGMTLAGPASLEDQRPKITLGEKVEPAATPLVDCYCGQHFDTYGAYEQHMVDAHGHARTQR